MMFGSRFSLILQSFKGLLTIRILRFSVKLLLWCMTIGEGPVQGLVNPERKPQERFKGVYRVCDGLADFRG